MSGEQTAPGTPPKSTVVIDMTELAAQPIINAPPPLAPETEKYVTEKPDTEKRVPEKHVSKSPRPDEVTQLTWARRFVTTALVVFVALFLYGAGHPNDWMRYHPHFMCIAFMGIMPDLVYRGKSVKRCRSMSDRNATIRLHLITGLLMKIVGVTGLVMAYMSKGDLKPHFATLHGQFGLFAIALLLIQTLLGGCLIYRIGPYVTLRKVHTNISFILLVVATTALLLGWETHYGHRALGSLAARLLFVFSFPAAVAFALWKE